MLKRFFISMLGTMAGLWISVALFIFGGLMLVGIMAGGSSDEGIRKHSVLLLDLQGAVEEREQEVGLQDILQGQAKMGLTLADITAAITAARDDKRIEGIVLNCGGSAMGFATRESVLAQLEEFKSTGKWILAYGDSYSQGDYILATSADSIFINPLGAVDIRGVGTSIPFFKGLMDKLGVKMQVVKVGTFKSAVEPFILNEMSEPSRLQTRVFIDSIWDFFSGRMAANRNLTPADFQRASDEILACRKAEVAKEQGFVDALIYKRQFEDLLREKIGLDEDEDVRYVSPAELNGETQLDNAELLAAIQSANKREKAEKPVHQDHIAVLYAVGDIVDSGKGGIVGETMVPQILELAKDDEVKAMILRVNSGGGSAFASEQIWEALEYFKSKGKTLYVSMGDYAASGGYYISCGADKIWAQHTTLTGSIGVFGMIPEASELINDKLGVHFSTVATSPNTVFPEIYSPMSAEQKAALQESVEQTYDLFTSRVATGRGMTQDAVKEIAEGRVWVGESAIGLGLVDELGSLEDAIEALRGELGDKKLKVVSYPEKDQNIGAMLARSGAFDAAMDDISGQSGIQELGLDDQTLDLLRQASALRRLSPVQARMEFMITE